MEVVAGNGEWTGRTEDDIASETAEEEDQDTNYGNFDQLLWNGPIFVRILGFLPKTDWLTMRQVNQGVREMVERVLAITKAVDVRSFLGPHLMFHWKEKRAVRKVCGWLGNLAPGIRVMSGGIFMPETLLPFRHLKQVDLNLTAETEKSALDLSRWKQFLLNAHELEKVCFSGYIGSHEAAEIIFKSLISPRLVHLDLSGLSTIGNASHIPWIADSLPAEQLELFGFPNEVAQSDYDRFLQRARQLKHLIIPVRCAAGTTNLITWDFVTAIRQLTELVSLKVPKTSRLDAPSLVGLISSWKNLNKLSFPLRGSNVPGIWPLLKEITQSSGITELELTDPAWDGAAVSRQLFRELSKGDRIESLVLENRSLTNSLRPLHLTSLTFTICRWKGQFELRINYPLTKLHLHVTKEFRGRIIVDCGSRVRSNLKELSIGGKKLAFVDVGQGLLLGLEQLQVLDLAEYRCEKEHYTRIRQYVQFPRLTRFIPPVYYS